MNLPATRALMLVVSAPSGAGKSTLCRELLARNPGMTYSISCTTRPPRPGEADGVHYHFLSREEFTHRVAAGEFLEHAEVYGQFYGTLKSHVQAPLAAGRDVLMDVDVQGVATIRAYAAAASAGDRIRRGFVDVFIAPPSLATLRARLEGRGQDAPDVIERRMRNAEHELGQGALYRYILVNDDVQLAAERLQAIVNSEHLRGGEA